MINRFLLAIFLPALLVPSFASAQPPDSRYFDRGGEGWDSGSGSDESGGGSSYLGVDIADVSAERLAELKLKEEHGAEVTMVDQDAPAGKAGLHEHDVIVSLNGAPVESAAQLRRMIKETPPGRVVTLGISRDGQSLTIKVQLADKHKSMEWEPENHFKMPKVTPIPSMPDFDLPVSVVIVHSSARSGLMVENMTPQLGEFFGVKDGNGVLVRSVEKGSRGEKAGFRAGDVVVKVNNQPVHDTSDFTHALRSSSGSTSSVTVMRDKKERTLNLTLPDKKDSGGLFQDGFSFDVQDFTAQAQEAINRAGDQIARLSPAIVERLQDELQNELPEKLRQQAARCQEMQKKEMQNQDMQKRLEDSEQQMRDEQLQLQKQQQRFLLEMSGKWMEI
jgi:serine protease Do